MEDPGYDDSGEGSAKISWSVSTTFFSENEISIALSTAGGISTFTRNWRLNLVAN
jgi:hypothetical protein